MLKKIQEKTYKAELGQIGITNVSFFNTQFHFLLNIIEIQFIVIHKRKFINKILQFLQKSTYENIIFPLKFSFSSDTIILYISHYIQNIVNR